MQQPMQQPNLTDCPILVPQTRLREMLGLKKTTFFKIKKQQGFPKPIKNGTARAGGVYYKRDEVLGWLETMQTL